MEEIRLFDLISKTMVIEKVYGEKAVSFLHSDGALSSFFRTLLCKSPLFSRLYGWIQKRSFTKRKIAPFVKEFGVEMKEFEKGVDEFRSFNDFFCRKLKPGVREISGEALIFPADGRYRLMESLNGGSIQVKGLELTVAELIHDEKEARRYEGGAALIARLAPPDYHRFHFPASGQATASTPIEGDLYSVNPLSLSLQPRVLMENQRMVSFLETEEYGKICLVEVGAINVGTIHQTYTPGEVKKGDEKGTFSFGGSAMVLLFEKGKVQFNEDLVKFSSTGLEVLAKMGLPVATQLGE